MKDASNGVKEEPQAEAKDKNQEIVEPDEKQDEFKLMSNGNKF